MALIICPECGKLETMHSEDNTVSCKACGWSLQINSYGMFSDPHFTNVRDLSDWQKEQIRLHAEENISYTSDFGELITVENHIESPITSGPIYMDNSAFRCGEKEFALDTVSELAMHGRRALVFTAEKEYFELLLPKGSNAIKYLLYFNAYKTQASTAKAE